MSLKKYDVDFLITVKRKFAAPARGIKTISDKSERTDIEAESEAEAMDKAFDDAVLELTNITGVTPDIDKPAWKFSVQYENGSSVVYSDFKIRKKAE